MNNYTHTLFHSIKIKCVLFFFFLPFANFASNFSENTSPTDTTNKNSYRIIEKINIAGNKQTKRNIILRELTFSEGDTIILSELYEKLKNSKKNLLNTPLFNFVNYNIDISDNQTIINFKVEERWYIWPYPILYFTNRNFNEWWETKSLKKLYYGIDLKIYNFKGRNETLLLKFIYGAKREFLLSYNSIFLDKKRKHSIWTEIGYSHQIDVNYQTLENKPVSFRNEDEKVFETKTISLAYFYRPKIHEHYNISLKYINRNAADTLIKLNPYFITYNRKEISYLNFYLAYTKDLRDSRNYPLEGSYFFATAGRTGLNIFNSKIGFFNFKTIYKKFNRISDKFFQASSITLQTKTKSPKIYEQQKALGYKKDFVRGFEYYVIDGDNFFLTKNLVKYELIPQTTKTLGFIPFKKFNKIHFASYLNLYFDAGYVHSYSPQYLDENNYMVKKFLYSGGIGLDLVTYYDTVFRFEFTMNSYKEAGFFLHFVAPL